MLHAHLLSSRRTAPHISGTLSRSGVCLAARPATAGVRLLRYACSGFRGAETQASAASLRVIEFTEADVEALSL